MLNSYAMNADPQSAVLESKHFDAIKHLLYKICGIDLKPGKEALVHSRLTGRLRTLEMDDFDTYLDYVKSDTSRRELTMLVDAMTTNKTHFFREEAHFDYLCRDLLPQWKTQQHLRIWCAGCSSGEEPYTLAIALREAWPHIDAADVRILATDISDTVLDDARAALYREDQISDVPTSLLQKYFTRTPAAHAPVYNIDPSVRHMVKFAALNLIAPWPMQGPFDVIFCRNVMIYFDQETRERLIERYYKLLRPGGYFFIGHSESLTGLTHSFDYVQPAIYFRPPTS